MPKSDEGFLMIFEHGPQKLVSKSGHKYSVLEPLKKLYTYYFLILEIRQMISLEKKNLKNEIFGVMNFITCIFICQKF